MSLHLSYLCLLFSRFKKEYSFLNIEACGDKAGNDEVEAKVIINDNSFTFFVPSNTCINRSIFINTTKEEKLNITLTSDTFGFCDCERVFEKLLLEKKPLELQKPLKKKR
jgi:hypothetical protein